MGIKKKYKLENRILEISLALMASAIKQLVTWLGRQHLKTNKLNDHLKQHIVKGQSKVVSLKAGGGKISQKG